jgi:ribonuclease R
LLTFLSQDPGTRVSMKELARHLDVQDRDEYHALRQLIDDLGRRGIVDLDERSKIGYVRPDHESGKKKGTVVRGRIVGLLTVTKRGLGIVRPAGSDTEIVIAPNFLHTGLHGDLVAVVPFARRMARRRDEGEAPLEGEVVEIVERRVQTITGTLRRSRHALYVEPDDERIPRDVQVRRDAARKAEDGDKVVVRLLPWTDEHQNPEGTVEEILGRAGDARVEVLSVARGLGLPMAFPREVQREAEHLRAEIPEQEIASRLDYRAVPTVTIDPEDAKDFDDALSCEQLPHGLLRVGVHIADVSHYVHEGSALDEEALARGTSVYMVNEVIPMLPERLSNDLCSLKPHKDRLTYSVLLDLRPDGSVTGSRITPSVIHSRRRFTYEEVQAILTAGRGEHADLLLPLFHISQTLMKRRRKNGSIDFETPEAKFKFDAHGFPSAIMKKVRLDAHRLVEECMLLANVTVARHVGAGSEEPKPLLYRVHDMPDPVRLRELASFVKGFGFSLDAKSGVTSRALQKLLDQVKGSEVEALINEIALRSMAKAEYAEKNIGHYGLAFPFYTHFTSPIRRYPDLVVHRLLKEYQKPVSARRLNALRETLPALAEQSSVRERVAMEAERESVKVMQAEYMKRHLGDEFDGVIGGVASFGFFVEINDLLVEGLIRVRDLADDYYLYDERQYALKGRSHGRVFRLGDPVRVRVVAVNPAERRMDFELVEE